MIVHCYLEPRMTGTEALYFFLPLALAGLSTAVILGVQWSVGLFSGRGQSFQQYQSRSKGAGQ